MRRALRITAMSLAVPLAAGTIAFSVAGAAPAGEGWTAPQASHSAMSYNAPRAMHYEAITAVPGMYYGIKPQMYYGAKPVMYYDGPRMYYGARLAMYYGTPQMYYGAKLAMVYDGPQMYYGAPQMFLDARIWLRPANLLGDARRMSFN